MTRHLRGALPLILSGLFFAGWISALPAQAQTSKSPKAGSGEAAESGQKSADGRQKEKDDVRRREEWFYHQRRYPLPMIPGGARQQAIQQRETMRQDLIRRGLLPPPGSPETSGAAGNPQPAMSVNWMPIGPMPTSAAGFFFEQTFNTQTLSGRINSIAVDPSTPSTVYLGGADGGLWKSLDSGMTWTPMTDSEPSLAIGSIAIDPLNPQTIYIGTGELNFAQDNYYGAGILKSVNGGTSWSQLGATPGSVTLAAGYVPPVGVPAPNSFVGPFNQVVGGSYFSDIVVNPTNSSKLLAGVRIFVNVDTGASSGVFCSDDGGMTWLQVVVGAPGTAVVMDPGGAIAYAALGNTNGDPQNGVYTTTIANQSCANQAQTSNQSGRWALSSSGLPSGLNAGRISLAISPSTPATLYAALANAFDGSSSLNGVFKSINSGGSWSRLNNTPDVCSLQCFYDMTIKVHPANANLVFFGGGAQDTSSRPDFLLLSTDGGNSWAPINFDANTNEIHVDVHAIAFSPVATGTTMFVGNDGGIWGTPMASNATAATINWTDLNSTLTLSQFYPGISIHPSSQLVTFGGLQDNGSQKYDAATNALQWTQVYINDGGYTYIDPATPSTVYATTEYVADPTNNVSFIAKSLTNGDLDPSTGLVSFSIATNGINGNDNAEFIPPLAGDPTPGNAKVLYFGTCNVYQTRDGASNWRLMPNSSVCATADYTTIAPAADGNTVYAGDVTGHVHLTINALAGASSAWTDVTTAPLPGSSTSGRVITKIAVDPANPQFAIVAYSGFCSFTVAGVLDNVGHIFETTNGGTTWTDISGGCNSGSPSALPNTPVNDVVIDPADPTDMTLYIATDVGVFSTIDGGATWAPLGMGLANGAVLSLTLRNTSRTLRAGLHGRGAWDFQLPGVPAYSLVSLMPVFAPLGTGPIILTVNGTGFTGAAVVQFGATPLTTNFISPTQLQATVPLALLATVASVPVSVTDTAGTSNALLFSVVVTSASPAPPNDLFPGLTIPSAQLSYTDTENTAAATNDTGGIADPRPTSVVNCIPNNSGLALNGTANSIWYTWTAPASGASVEADTIGSTQDTILLVGTGSGGSVVAVPGGCNDDIISGVVSQSQVFFSATANTTYHFMISDFEGAGGQFNSGNTVVFNFNATALPTLTMISPSSGAAGFSTNVTLTGTNFTAPLTVNAGTGITVSNTVLVNSTTITATFQIAGNAPLGPQNVTVTTPGGTTPPQTFTVTATPAPTLTMINPISGAQGANVNVTLTGTNFVTGAMVNFAGAGVTVTNTVVVNLTTITATFQIAVGATLGAQNVTVTTPSGGPSGPLPFTVVPPPPPTLTMLSQTSGAQGTNVNVTLTGTNFISGAGATTVLFGGANVTVVNTMVVNSTTITVTFQIAANAALGAQNVSVMTSGGTSGALPFTVTLPPPPTLTSISPTSGVQGQMMLSVTLTGTNFITGATVMLSGAGVTVSNIVVVNSTTITAMFAIAANTALGPQNVSVTTAGGTSATVAFTVNSDFNFMATSLSGSVLPGGAAMSTLTITPTTVGAQFPGPVTFGCTGLPFETSCNFTPGSLAATATTPPANMVNLSIQTTMPSSVFPGFARRIPGPWFGVLAWAGILLAFAGLLLVRRASRVWRYVMGAALVLAISGLAGACGGGGGVHNPGTPPGGPFPITIMVTSGGVTHTATFNLTVQ
jgi:hypothetical protein